ncbi:MAG: ABC transporter ATP-binding protein [Pirellulales bacterium]|nr:ABC transporter ATP-binding protein [Pirellulales bacterium]
MDAVRNGNDVAVVRDLGAGFVAASSESPDAGTAKESRSACKRPSRDRLLLEVRDVSLSFGGIRALRGVGFEVARGEIVSIIGPNGAGKTSIANVISALYQPSSGRILFDGKDRTSATPQEVARLGITRTFQNLALFRGLTVADNILVGRHIHMGAGLLASGVFLGKARNEEARHRQFVNEILDLLDLGDYRNQQADTLAYGLQKRVELARALALEPSLLLLDEPMAGMNRDEKKAMVEYIATANADLGISIVLIEHDMGVVMDVSDWVVVLNHGEKICEGRPEDVQNNHAVIEAYLGQETK